MIDYRKIQYGELAQDADFVNSYENLREALEEMQKVLDELLPLRAHYNSMDLPQRIEYDIFLAYTVNSFYWVHLRLLGIDPMTTPIKDELHRTKVAMMKWKEIKEKSKRPTVDIQAAKRFIKSGLYDGYQGNDQPKNKKIKFNDDDQV